MCWYVSQAFGDVAQRVGEAINDDEKERHGHFWMGIRAKERCNTLSPTNPSRAKREGLRYVGPTGTFCVV